MPDNSDVLDPDDWRKSVIGTDPALRKAALVDMRSAATTEADPVGYRDCGRPMTTEERIDAEYAALTDDERKASGEVVETADVFALVAAYDHEVGSPTAPEFETYDEARDAGIVLLTVNENVVSFRIDKRTTRKA